MGVQTESKFRKLFKMISDSKHIEVNAIGSFFVNHASEEIMNRKEFYENTRDILLNMPIDMELLHKTINKKGHVVRGHALLNSQITLFMKEKNYEAAKLFKDLIEGGTSVPNKDKIDKFLVKTCDLAFHTNEGKRSESNAALFSSAILSAVFPKNFVDYRIRRWNKISQLFDLEEISKDYSTGEKIIWAGRIAGELSGTSVFKEFFNAFDVEPYWIAASLAMFLGRPSKTEFWPIVEKFSGLLNGKKIPPANGKKKTGDIMYPLNQIIYGPPGTGKTYNTINYALAILEGKALETINSQDRTKLLKRFNSYRNNGQVEFITFHQSYAYEDFIQGLKPDAKNTDGKLYFELKDGVFKVIADKAIENYKASKETTAEEVLKKYVIIIDEINRANISRVFGELITLIEDDKRFGQTSEMRATLPSGEPFSVPPNLYIIGTMNTADKSIALIDIALRRRFEFEKLYPDVELVAEKYRELFNKINKQIVAEKGPDFQIGHAYFMKKSDQEFNLKNVMNKKIIPLLYEYFMNEGEEVKSILNKAGVKTIERDGLCEFESYSNEHA
ncbi:MAG: McrB family protein [Methanosarcinaceae archaeon]